MIETGRTASALTGRPLREKVIGQTRQLASIVESLAPATRTEADGDAMAQLEPTDLERDVSTLLDTIHKVTETYGLLLDKLSAYELKVRDLTRKLSEEERITGDALRAAAHAEQTAREAQAKAARAEAEAERSTGSARELERQLGTLRAQTAKLMKAVDQLFPELDEAPEPARGLRVVR